MVLEKMLSAGLRVEVVEEFHLLLPKGDEEIQQQVVLPQPLKNDLQVLHMCCLVRAVHRDVIRIDENECETGSHHVHDSLVGLPCIPEAKRHAERFPQTKKRK